MHELYLKKEGELNKALIKTLQNELITSVEDRLEFVKVICRAKAPVCNWHDMELQILKGSL
jgi:chorismate mutase